MGNVYDPERAYGSAEWDALDREGIHKCEDGTYVISTGRMGTGYWRPGIFESARAARLGRQLLDEDIQALQDAVTVITEAMIVERKV